MNEKKKKDDYSDDIGRKVYDQIWKGELWGPDGAIKWSHARYGYLKLMSYKGEGASALSSMYYTVWGNAVSQIGQASIKLKLLWLVRGIGCAFWALAWSRFAEKEIGFENMTYGQLDVRASILVKCHMYRKAKKYLRSALNKEEITDDSRVLVLCKLGEVYDKLGVGGGIFFEEAIMALNVKNTTRVRALKASGAHMLRQKKSQPLDYKEKAKYFLEQALEIAKRDNLGDQIVKIKALMKKC